MYNKTAGLILDDLGHKASWLKIAVKKKNLLRDRIRLEFLMVIIKDLKFYETYSKNNSLSVNYQNRINTIESYGKKQVRKNSKKWHILDAEQETLRRVIIDMKGD